jgi:hypothetical protein
MMNDEGRMMNKFCIHHSAFILGDSAWMYSWMRQRWQLAHPSLFGVPQVLRLG